MNSEEKHGDVVFLKASCCSCNTNNTGCASNFHGLIYVSKSSLLPLMMYGEAFSTEGGAPNKQKPAYRRIDWCADAWNE